MDTAMMVPLFSQLLVMPLMFLSEKTDIATAETPGVEYGKAYGTLHNSNWRFKKKNYSWWSYFSVGSR